MQQTFVKFTLPAGTYIHANEMREAVAKGLDGQMFQSKPGLFNYLTETKTNCNRPENRFIGGLGWVGFVSDNDPLMTTQVVAPAISFLMGKGFSPDTRVGEKDKRAVLTDEPNVYRLTGLVDQRDKRRESETGVVESAADLVKRHVIAMFEDAFDKGVIDSPFTDDDLNIMVLESRRSGESVKFRNGGQKAVAKVRATFAMQVRLEGIWQAGHLQSRGYGLVYSVNKGMHTQCPI